ncbi:R2-like ligand-binding oxidase [Halobacillus amylolyticus]|uniref:R2-like ligand binding oxidase n=1 Tax=Halobacillus amylolyticus TaxID=2932259 RepID=A0ABY4H9D4_9BACI|nr:R2-like ligand-binding oxidase [Halobacillus amylolyticus]UOR11481.1 R2-like ligand-binding oxidase [Halobacillus amylolyticus]
MRDQILTTSARGLKEDSFPFRLYQKAKRLGVWDPRDIDFTQDKEDWKTLTAPQQQSILRLISQFQAGEEAVTLDLLPEIMLIAKQGRIEEEMFLTTFLFEEAKHTEFFRIVLNVIGEQGDLSHFHSDTYKQIFYEILPEAMNRLHTDESPEALAEAAVVYNMFVEGVLAETGYWSFYRMLDSFGKMPGLMKGIEYLKRDESRHIAYGTFLLQRLVCEHPHLYDHITQKLNDLAPLSLQLNQEGAEQSAYDVPLEETVRFSQNQLAIRLEKVARARGKTIEEIYKPKESV